MKSHVSLQLPFGFAWLKYFRQVELAYIVACDGTAQNIYGMLIG